jgi:cyclopropane fatty-acyl-phospholipid synthase-like methyltransferase
MSDVLRKIDAYYTGKLHAHGPTPLGVDWNSAEAQQVRFVQTTRVCPDKGRASVLDFGCGYGALAPFLLAKNPELTYVGYDVSEEMIAAAQRLHPLANVRFTSRIEDVRGVDVTVASGIFSVKMDVAERDWEAYIFETLDRMASLSSSAFSFNMLTAYSDPDRMRSDLYYADPHRFFDRCRTRYSRNVALLHDYGLYEFTILVRLTV